MMINTSHIITELPYLISFTLISILLVFAMFLSEYRASRLKETLRKIILLYKDQPLPNQLSRAIYHQLRLPLKYKGNQVMDNHLRMIEMLEQQTIASLEWLRLKQLIVQLFYALRLAFARIINLVRMAVNHNG